MYSKNGNIKNEKHTCSLSVVYNLIYILFQLTSTSVLYTYSELSKQCSEITFTSHGQSKYTMLHSCIHPRLSLTFLIRVISPETAMPNQVNLGMSLLHNSRVQRQLTHVIPYISFNGQNLFILSKNWFKLLLLMLL